MISNKVRYFLGSAKKSLLQQGFECPGCGSSMSAVVSRKYFVTALRRCSNCALQFRTPTTSAAENYLFYQDSYSQGFTTDVPSLEELDALKQAGFEGAERDYSRALRILNALGCQPGQRLLDCGCSWGYGSWQLAQAGYQVVGLEISAGRCEYAKKNLGIEAYDDPEDVTGPFDIFFCSHVIEHVPSPAKLLEFAVSSVKPGGWIVILTPNGSQQFRAEHPKEWNHLWGMVHPHFLDEVFLQQVFSDSLLVGSSEIAAAAIEQWAKSPKAVRLSSLEGSELLAVTRISRR